jgi:predicted porin
MKKSLLALAAMGAFAGAVQAQSSVTVYGILDVSYGQDEIDQGPLVAASVKTAGLADSRNASSRLGFRGTEDLGGGMEAGFVLEAGLNITGGATFNKTNGQVGNAQTGVLTVTQADNAVFGAATRQAFVTLGTKEAGTLLVGYKKLPESDFNDLFVLGTENTDGSEAQETQRIGRGNLISYTTPTFSGLSASIANSSQTAAYGLAATETAQKVSANVNQINLNYQMGPALVVAHMGIGSVENGTTATVATAVSGAGAAGNNSYNSQGIGASYDFGVARVAALYGKRETGVKDASQLDSTYTSFAAAIPFGKNAVKLTYSMAETKDKTGNITAKLSGMQFLAEHNLSKRSVIWAIYGNDKIDAVTAAAAVASQSAVVAAAAEVKQTSLRIGMTHSF